MNRRDPLEIIFTKSTQSHTVDDLAVILKKHYKNCTAVQFQLNA
jgi:hypothetical protein